MGRTRWEYSVRNEAMKVVHDAHYLATGFYKINNFVVLPYGDPLAQSDTDWFPDLPFFKIPRFWERAKKVNAYQIPISASFGLIEEVEKLLLTSSYAEPKYKGLARKWDEIENVVLNSIEELVFGRKGNITEIVIYPTLFGNRCSFGAPVKFPSDLKLFVREDGDIYTIAEAILTSVVRRKMEKDLEASWSESEMFVDWNLLNGPIGRLLLKFQPDGPSVLTMKTVRAKQMGQVIEKSEAFYKKIGAPNLVRIFDGIDLGLSGNNKKLYELLQSRQNQVVSVDEIGSSLFLNEDDFSLYAISKSVERLRNKFEESGISGSYIQAIRGKGYMLRN